MEGEELNSSVRLRSHSAVGVEHEVPGGSALSRRVTPMSYSPFPSPCIFSRKWGLATGASKGHCKDSVRLRIKHLQVPSWLVLTQTAEPQTMPGQRQEPARVQGSTGEKRWLAYSTGGGLPWHVLVREGLQMALLGCRKLWIFMMRAVLYDSASQVVLHQ